LNRTSHEIRMLVHGDITDSVNMTIGTPTMSRKWTVPLWPSVRTTKQQTEKSLNQKRSGYYWSTGAGKWIDRVNVTIDHQLQQELTVSI
jgi:hypothetical protein